MQLPTELTPAQRAALVECLRVFADCGYPTRETRENKMPSSVTARDGGDQHGTETNQSSVIPALLTDKTPHVNPRRKEQQTSGRLFGGPGKTITRGFAKSNKGDHCT